MSESKEPREKIGFLNRVPEKIAVNQLHEGGFLLSADIRSQVDKIIKANENFEKSGKGERISYSSFSRGRGYPPYEVYINGKNEAFVLGPELGSGSFGTVYITQNCATGKWQCMKRLTENSLEKVELEILQQEGMYKSHQQTAGKDLFVGELIQGKNLEDFLVEHQSLSFEQVLALNISIVEAYESLQRKGYVHRDIKPGNIMFDEERHQCFAIDFGLVRKKDEISTKLAGSLGYMAPEVIAGKPFSFADDIYAMGLVAGEIFSLGLPPSNNMDLGKFLKTTDPKRLRYIGLIKRNLMLRKEAGKYKGPVVDGEEMHKDIQNIVRGAKDADYQKGLSAEQIKLCTLIYNMTGARGKVNEPTKDDRPEKLDDILKEMRDIRLAHITNKIKTLKSSLESSLNEYDKELITLYEQRRELSSAPHFLDNLDIFLLRGVDATEENRPKLAELKEYGEKLAKALEAKRVGVKEIQTTRPVLKNRQQELLISSNSIGVSINNLPTTNPDSELKKMFQNKLLDENSLLQNGLSVEPRLPTKKIQIALAELDAIKHKVEKFNEIINLKIVIDSLKKENEKYKEKYEDKNLEEKSGFLFFANKDAKNKNAIELNNRLQKLLDGDISDPAALKAIIDDARALDRQQGAGFFNIRKRSAVEQILLKAEEKLKQAFPDHPALQTPTGATTKFKSQLKKLFKK